MPTLRVGAKSSGNGKSKGDVTCSVEATVLAGSVVELKAVEEERRSTLPLSLIKLKVEELKAVEGKELARERTLCISARRLISRFLLQ